jgi:histidyl-tRNA synthetase
VKFKAQRGTEDILPSQVHRWNFVEDTYSQLARQFGYGEIRTPVFEDLELFKRTAGEFSDVVRKEMYDFYDKGDRHLALRPEGTAPAMRAAIEHNLAPQGVHARLFYITSCYRYGRPQKGRLRELHQLGAELMGSSSPAADAEVIEFAYRFISKLGLGDAPIMINSIGKSECRARYSRVIVDHLKGYLDQASDEVKEPILKNPLGVLDSKDEVLKELVRSIPPILDFLEEDSRANFEALKLLLTEAGVKFVVNPSIVRGLDYYNDTVFEFEHPALPGLSLFGGGRYDNLVKLLGGSPTPAVGFGMGVERLLLAIEAVGYQFPMLKADFFVVTATESARSECRKLVRELRDQGFHVLHDVDSRSLKSQMRQVDSSGAKHALILGEDEISGGTVTVRDMMSGEQKIVERTKLTLSME